MLEEEVVLRSGEGGIAPSLHKKRIPRSDALAANGVSGVSPESEERCIATVDRYRRSSRAGVLEAVYTGFVVGEAVDGFTIEDLVC